MPEYDPDMVFWKAVASAKELLLNSELLKKTKLDIPAEKAVMKAMIILMLANEGRQKPQLPVEIKELCDKFRKSNNPFERMELLEKIKSYGD